MQKFKVLLIDDDQEYCQNFKAITRDVFDIEYALDGKNGIEKFDSFSPHIIFLDYWFGEKETGLDILKKIRKIDCNIPVIMISEQTSVEIGVEAMKLGAYHYTAKYSSVKELLIIVNQEITRLKEKLVWERQASDNYDPFLGNSPVMGDMKKKIRQIASSNSTVLITGETGVGKEMVAWEIHKQSNRSRRPFIVINSTAISEQLFESELFGHKKGAFTSATNDHVGRIELADHGTVVFDEIGVISTYLQAKLLRFLETKKIQRIGDEREISVDLRIIAATNVILDDAIKNKNFREDLFYRINVLNIAIPPIRDRKEDIPVLTDYYLKKFYYQIGKQPKDLNKQQKEIMQEYHWPGNVREIKNVLERYSVFEDDKIFESLQNNTTPSSVYKPSFDKNILNLPYKEAYQQTIHEFQRYYFRSIINQCDGNIKKAAELIGIPRSTIYRALKDDKTSKID